MNKSPHEKVHIEGLKDKYRDPERMAELEPMYKLHPQLLKAHQRVMKRTCDPQELIETLTQCGGNITMCANKYHVTRMTIIKWLKEDGNYEIVEEIDEAWNDIAETQLNNKILDGNLDAVKFRLRTKAKHRGYFEKQEHEINQTIKVKLEDGSDDW